jgi:hypothetical protein
MVFWRLDILSNIEQIIEKESALLAPRGIKNIADMLLQIGVDPSRAIQVACGGRCLQAHEREMFNDLFDKDKIERFECERDIGNLKKHIVRLRRRKIDNINELYATQDEIKRAETDLAGLKAKLTTFNVRNSVPASTYRYPSQDELLERRLIIHTKTLNPFPVLTKRGLLVYESSLELSDLGRSRVERGMPIDSDFIQGSWLRMREIYVKEGKLKRLINSLI